MSRQFMVIIYSTLYLTFTGVSVNFAMEIFVVPEERGVAIVCVELIGETETEIDVELSTSSGSAIQGMFRPKW